MKHICIPPEEGYHDGMCVLEEEVARIDPMRIERIRMHVNHDMNDCCEKKHKTLLEHSLSTGEIKRGVFREQ